MFLLALPACKRGPDRSDGALPSLQVPRAKETITIDGALNEASWSHAADTKAFVSPSDGAFRSGSDVNASAKVLWDDERLYLAITVADDEASSPFSRDAVDPHVWSKASGIELMLQPGDPGNNRDYYEVQVDVNGAVWDTRFDDYNAPITKDKGGKRFGHQGWKSGVARAVHHEEGEGYTIELSLPWSSLVTNKGRAPKPGEVWRANLYSFRDGQRDALAWSPLLKQGNFHKASRFGKLTFVE